DRVEDGRSRIAQEGHTAVLFGLPQGPAPFIPLGLHSLVERIIEVGGVAEGELFAAEEGRTKAQAQQRGQARENHKWEQEPAHGHRVPRRVRSRLPPSAGNGPAELPGPPGQIGLFSVLTGFLYFFLASNPSALRWAASTRSSKCLSIYSGGPPLS